MGCKITYNKDGKITGVKDQNGNDSTLFREIVSNPHISAEQGVEIYKQTFSDKIKTEEESIIDPAKENNTYLKAPNGQPTNLSPEQWVQVRTRAFKDWFGDWENNPAEASKVVDENGEPMVVYHGSPNSNIDEFNSKSNSRENKSGLKEEGTYFTTNKNLANFYVSNTSLAKEALDNINKEIENLSQRRLNIRNNNEWDSLTERINSLEASKRGKSYPIFLNLKTIKEFDAQGKENVEAWNNLEVQASYKTATNRDAMNFLKNGRFGVEKVDGIRANNIVDAFVQGDTRLSRELVGDVFLVFDTTQGAIKSATENTGEFSPESNNIRFKVGAAENNTPIELTEQLIERLKQTGLVENVELLTNEEILQKLDELNVEEVQKQDDSVKGFVLNNSIYLNTENISLDTPIHEFSHLYNSWTKQNRPKLYEKGVSLIEEELNKDNSEIQDVIDFVKRTQPNLKGEVLKEEILTELIGRRGTELLNSNKKSPITDWLKEVWDSIKNALGLSQYSIEEVRKMDLGEYSNAVAIDLLRGEPIEKMFSNKILGNSEVKIEVQYLEEAKKQELIDQGLLTEEPNLNFLADQKVITTSPDDMLVGNVNIYNMDGKNISTKKTTEGSGGLFFVTKYGEIWAFRNETGAKKFATVINKTRKENGGKTWLVLTKGNDSKLMSNPQGVTNSLNITTSLMEAGFISKSDMRKAVSDAVKKYEDVINIPLTATTEEVKKRVAQFFENEKNISFVKRGDVLKQIITNLNATNSFKQNRLAIAEFLGADPNNFTLKTQVQDAIALVSSEKFTQGLESGDIYAAIEVNNDVFVEKGTHEVFEASIIEKDSEGNKVAPKLTLIGGSFSAYTNMQTEEGESLQEVDPDDQKARKSFRARVTGGGNTGFGKGTVKPEVRFSKGENKNKSAETQDFFSDVVTGKSEKFKPNKSWVPILPFTKTEESFKEIYDKYKGNFDEHIATSIPTFRETQIKVGSVISQMYNKALVYDIGGSEGGFVKSITEASNGDIRSINLDPNPDMQKVHEKTPVEGSDFVREAFYEGFEDNGVVYEKHVPQEKADVVHESMVFQFITPERREFVKEVADNYVKEDGIFLTEEKLLPESEEVWRQNESNKNIHKLNYYSSEQLTQKSEEVLVGMKKNQTYQEDYINALKEHFAFVEEYWDAGNFKGIVATNSEQKLNEFFDKIGGKITSEYSSVKNTPEITPENSSNYANMTEDGQGNFVFFHKGKKGYDVVKTGTGQSLVTSKSEAAAIQKVGGLAMYYTNTNTSERQGSDEATYAVKVPKEKVYDFNTDLLNLIDEAEKQHKIEHPNKAFDINTQVAYITKIAGERGFDMVVADWNGKTRAQTTKNLKPSDVKELEGNKVTQEFKETYKSNIEKGYKSIVPKTKNELLKEVYDDINKEKNKTGNYDKLYHLYADYTKYSQEEITKLIQESDIPQGIKDRYNTILTSKQARRRSEPSLTYQTPNNETYPTFKEALKNTQTGEIKANIGNVTLFTVDSSTDYNTYNGTINGLIKSGILSGESILEPTGEKVVLTEGAGDIIKVINSIIAKEALIKVIGRSNIKETLDSNFIISEAGANSVQIRNSEGTIENIPLDTLENGVKEELKKQFPDTYMDIISMQAYRTLFKGTSNQTEGLNEIEFTPENELQQALIALLNKMGVKITSITDYVSKFAAKNGVEPSAAALADLANLIVAFKDGNITTAELSEEVAHFIVETLPEAEIENLLRNIHRTAEWQQHSDNYFKIYKEQNPNISEAELEQLVRKEILGKVLAASFENNFNTQEGSETQKSIVQRLADLFNSFIEKIRARFKPQYATELENWTNKVYANLMAEDLYDQLDKTQLEGKGYLMYSSSKKADDPITQINVRAQKAVNVLESNVGRLREGSSKTELNQYRADLEKLDEQSKILGVSGIVGVAKRQTAYLKKILDANKKQNHPFTQDENAVYINTVGVMLNYMTEIRSLLDSSNKTHKRIIDQVDSLIKDINSIKGDKNVLQDTAWENMVEELAIKLSLTPTEKQQLLDAYIERTDQNGNKIGGQGKKDTNWFFAHIAPMVHAQDPALNMASNIISKMTMRHGVNTYNRVKNLFDKWEKLGIKEPNKLLKTWKKGSYLFNPIKYEILDQEILQKKTELYNKYTGEELSPEDFQEAEKTDNLNFNSVVDQVNFYEDISEFRKENHYVDYLTKSARGKRNKMYEGLSKEAVRIDKNLSRERGQVGQEADRFGSYTQEHKYRLQQINKKRQRAKNPYNSDGQLKPGLVMEAGEIAKDPRVQNIDVDAQIVLDLQELDKRKMEAFKEKNKEDKPIPQRFKDLLGVAQTEEEAIELLFLNANISFTNEFWDSLAANDSFVNKLEAKPNKTEKTTEIIERLKSLQKRRSTILKANKVHNLPSEIDFEEMEGSEIMAIKDLSEQLQAAYQDARNELGEVTNEETQEPVFSSVVNEAYKEQIKNRSLEDSVEEEFEFIKEHTTKSDSLSLEKARGIAEDIIRGRDPRLSDFYKTVFKEEYTGTEQEIREEVYQDLVDYSKGKLLPYFKRIEPTTGQSFTQVMGILKGGQKTALDFISEFEAGQYPSIQVTPNYIFYDETNNDERNPEYDKNERLGLPQIQSKYRDSEFEKHFGFNYDTAEASKNQNEYKAWQALVEFHEESLEVTNMKDRHNKFLLPQKGVRGARQMHKLLSGPNKLNTLKEVLKDMTSFRQDEKEYGETSDGKVLGGKEGDLRIPKYGFNKLDNQLDLTDELLESYIWMGSEAELYTARVGAFADMEAIKNLISNNTYSNKEGEKSRIYKMFDSFYRYNIYGQNEEFSYETDFFGISPKKYNLAPLAKKLQFWVRLVNLGFNLIVPLTSLLQGGVNLTIERFVGERIDKDASKLARRDLPKYLTEAVGDTLALNGKSKMSSMAELLGVFEIEGRFRDSNYNRFTRGMLRTGFITHTIADAPIKAQVMLTVLKDMRIVDGDVINFNRFRQQRMFEAKEKGETVNDKQLREQWRKYEDKTFDKYMSTKDGITQIEKQKLKDDLFGNTPISDIQFEDILELKLQFIRDSIQRTAQEIDTMIPNEERSFGQRHAIFSFFFLHRGWMTVAYNRKFKSRHLNTHTGITEEGNWNGSAEFIKGWVNEWKNPNNTKTFLKTLKSQWEAADDTTRRSMHRTMVEVLMVNSLAALSLLLMGMADDEEDSWPAQFGAYMGYRVSNETITATVAYPRQVMDFLESPIVGLDKLRAASEIWDVTSSDLVERGKYKDQTKRMRFIYKNLPAFKEYYNVKNAGQTRDTYEFYNRDNVSFPWVASAYFMSQNKD